MDEPEDIMQPVEDTEAEDPEKDISLDSLADDEDEEVEGFDDVEADETI